MQDDSTCTAYNIIGTLPVLVYISTSVQSTEFIAVLCLQCICICSPCCVGRLTKG